MQIVIDARVLEAQHSGVGTYVHQLVRGLCQIGGGEQYRLLLCRPGSLPRKDLPRCAPWLTRFSHENHPLGDLWESFWLPRVMERRKIDLFHGPAFLIPLAPTRIPLVVTIHDLVAFAQRQTIPFRYGCYMRWITKLSAHTAKRIIVVSEYVRQGLLSRLELDPAIIRTIPLGVSEMFSPDEEHRAEELRFLQDRYGLLGDYVLFVGNLEPRKSLPLLIQAFDEVRRRHPAPLQLALCGKWGWLWKGIARALGESPARDAIVLTGYVPREHLPMLYRRARVFAFPSLSEGFGLPVLEAMASGLPVVCSRAGALPEVVGDAAILHSPGDAEALVEGLLTVLSRPERAEELIRRGLARVKEYRWEMVARRTLAVYRELAPA